MIEKARQEALKGRSNLLLDKNGKQLRKRTNGVYTARDGIGRNAVTSANIEWAVPVNLDAISMVLEIGADSFFPDAEPGRVARTDITLRAIHTCALNDNVGRGLIPQTYEEAQSGRLYGTGELSLQNVTREAKRVALHGAHEYDFENCHYRLVASIAEEAEIDVPVISEYLNDPRGYRNQLASDIGITYSQAKKCLLAIMFGATKGLWFENAIPALIGPEKAAWLHEMPQYDELAFEIFTVADHLRKYAKRLSNGAIVNCRGKACIGNPRQELAHLLQGLEAELLHVVLDEYADDILIIQHDGFTMSRKVDPAEIEALLSYKAGIEMGVTYEQLLLPTES